VVLVLDILLIPVFPSFRKYAYHLPASLLAASLCLILIDNFTYTIFNFGIFDANTAVRLLYGFAFFGGIYYIVAKFSSITPQKETQAVERWLMIFAAILLFSSLLIAVPSINSDNPNETQNIPDATSEKLPNIFFISTDGLNASNMSVYGYERDTTPFIRKLAVDSLISKNHFSNSSKSTGSETALLTGKLPISSRVLYPPDILQGKNAYQHLPGILKKLGYRTLTLGEEYNTDANALNFQNAFDVVNCKKNTFIEFPGTSSGFDDGIYFLNLIGERITDRIKHIYLIKNIENPYTLVTKAETYFDEDQQRLNCLRAELDTATHTGVPLFAHIHLLGTHGDFYYPSVRVFSSGKTQDEPLMVDFYDDAILDFDLVVQHLVRDL